MFKINENEHKEKLVAAKENLKKELSKEHGIKIIWKINSTCKWWNYGTQSHADSHLVLVNILAFINSFTI